MKNIYQELQKRSLEKVYRYGTQRICEPEQTWQKIEFILSEFGITRIADITWLDRIGIPVYVAIRPNSKTLAQSNGKGLTQLQAKVSAVMESIEVWHAEVLKEPDCISSLEEIKNLLTYDPYDIQAMPEGFLCSTIPIEWVSCEDISNGVKTFLPRELLNLDWNVRNQACLPVFMSNTVGLASGNNLLEATLHGLSEILECDGLVQYGANSLSKKSPRLINLDSINSPLCLEIIEKYKKADAKLSVDYIGAEFNVPVFQVNVSFDDHLGVSMGYGCHPNRETALLRALTEAAQCRATVISGARDDIPSVYYYTVQRAISENRFIKQLSEVKNSIDYNEIPTSDNIYIEDDIRQIIDTLQERLNTVVLVVDLSVDKYDIAVVKVVVPKLQHPLHKMGTVRVSRSAQTQ